MKRTEIGYYDLVQLHKSGDKDNQTTIATCLVDGDIDNRFDCIISADLEPIMWDKCKGDWDNEKIAKIECTYIDIDGQPENPILTELISKKVLYHVKW